MDLIFMKIALKMKFGGLPAELFSTSHTLGKKLSDFKYQPDFFIEQEQNSVVILIKALIL